MSPRPSRRETATATAATTTTTTTTATKSPPPPSSWRRTIYWSCVLAVVPVLLALGNASGNVIGSSSSIAQLDAMPLVLVGGHQAEDCRANDKYNHQGCHGKDHEYSIVTDSSSLSPPQPPPPFQSTEEMHKAPEGPLQFFGKYRDIRARLDYDTYHLSPYTQQRQLIQDEIIDLFLHHSYGSGAACKRPQHPWIVFTAGAMGAGKSYTIRRLAQMGRFPLHHVHVDADDIRRLLPEFASLVQTAPLRAGEGTRKEAGFIAEILTLVALQSGQNVLVDGTLRDAEWYSDYFAQLRGQFPHLLIAILHITAPQMAVYERAEKRAQMTGRSIPREVLDRALREVPGAISILKQKVDFFCELYNSPHAADVELRGDMTWDEFERQWIQHDCDDDDDEVEEVAHCLYPPSEEELTSTLSLDSACHQRAATTAAAAAASHGKMDASPMGTSFHSRSKL